MGFSVTASHAIFFVATLSAASAAIGVYWTNQDLLEEARRAEAERTSNIMHTAINITDISCSPLSCDVLGIGSTITYKLNNNGDTTLAVSKLVYLLHGDILTAAPVVTIRDSLGNVMTGTDLLAPREQATITHTLTAVYTGVKLKVVTEYGVAATGSA